MIITLQPTEEFFLTDDGVPMRAWKGLTGKGVPIIAFISAICADEARADAAAVDQLRLELHSIPGPHTVTRFEVRPEMNEPGCKNHGGPVNALGGCLICDAEAGETCRLTDIRP